ncbi:serine/threonine-protein kinase [Nonomuraea sp. NPDC048826]|uniref:serine/threonine-protein kinase n=1 Tax=Nonomuraea sp. NPDC048826 TaxID=3364347 RepID=UPI0037180631
MPPAEAVFKPLQPGDPREVGGYRIIARLGEGGMGRVYLGTTQAGRRLAIKVIRPEFSHDAEFRRRFEHEVSAAQRVHSMYTAPVIDADVAGPHPWLATAFVPGPTLAQVVAAHGPLPVGTVRVLMAGVAEALLAVHAAGVIHRDLKPSNVLLAADGPKVIDFGIARAAESTALTRTGVRIGTPPFMAPEQALGHPSTPALDVFALGSLTCFAATGAAPFGDGPAPAVLYRIAHEQPGLDDCPDELRPLVSRCLAKAPDQRPRIREIISTLRIDTVPGDWLPEQVSGRLPAFTAEPPPAPATMPGGRRGRGRLVAAAAAVLLAATTVAVLVLNNPRTPDAAGRVTGTPLTPSRVVVTETVTLRPTAGPSASEEQEPEAEPTTTAAVPSPTFPGQPKGIIHRTETIDFRDHDGEDLDNEAGDDIEGDAAGLGAQSSSVLFLREGGRRPLLSDCRKIREDQWEIFIEVARLRLPAIICVRTAAGRYGYLRIHDIFFSGNRASHYYGTYAMWKMPGDR